MDRVIGIDLGTTNSCVAICEEGEPRVIPNRGGYPTTPSIVAFTEAGKRLVGHIAKRQAVTNPTNTIFAAKRLIGRAFKSDEVNRTVDTVAYQLVEGKEGDVRIVAGNREYTVQEISAYILTEMKKVAEEHLGHEVVKAVVTVPAYFGDAQRQATKVAGEVAGLDVIRIINEPTAAALAYGFERQVSSSVAVYDLGGGTFDISIMTVDEGVYEVLSTSGDTFLGGIDFDNRIIDYLAEAFLGRHGIDLRQDKIALQRLKEAAENAKCELSFKTSLEVTLPFIASKDNVPIHLQQEFTQGQLEDLVADLVDRTISICRSAQENSGLDLDEIDEVILVGGQTRMPLVQKRVEEFFGKAACKGLNPDEVVALGAAIQGNALVGEGEGPLLLDVTPKTLGIATVGGGFSKLIPRDTTIPVQKSHSFTTVSDNQSAVKIVVLQGESDRAVENELLGEFLLGGIRPAPKGVPDILVTFSIDADGIVSVAAKDRDTGKEQSITVTLSGGLSQDELETLIQERMNQEVAEKESDDMAKLIYHVESLNGQLSGKMPLVESTMGAEQVDAFVNLGVEVKRAISSRDWEALKKLETELQDALEIIEQQTT